MPERDPWDPLIALYGKALPVARAAASVPIAESPSPKVQEMKSPASTIPGPRPAAPASPPSFSIGSAGAAPASKALPPRLNGKPERVQLLLDLWEREIRDCRKCPLAPTRIQSVFGEGNTEAEILFVGEGPGREEDKQGRPFVGPAGQLLDKMIAAMGLKREEVFIANAVKCHPPGVPPLQNRPPSPEEIQACHPYLRNQVEILKPKIIVALGRTAAEALGLRAGSLASLRGKSHDFLGFPLRVTYHPSALLRPSDQQKEMKKAAWEDLKQVLGLIGRTVPSA